MSINKEHEYSVIDSDYNEFAQENSGLDLNTYGTDYLVVEEMLKRVESQEEVQSDHQQHSDHEQQQDAEVEQEPEQRLRPANSVNVIPPAPEINMELLRKISRDSSKNLDTIEAIKIEDTTAEEENHGNEIQKIEKQPQKNEDIKSHNTETQLKLNEAASNTKEKQKDTPLNPSSKPPIKESAEEKHNKRGSNSIMDDSDIARIKQKIEQAKKI